MSSVRRPAAREGPAWGSFRVLMSLSGRGHARHARCVALARLGKHQADRLHADRLRARITACTQGARQKAAQASIECYSAIEC